MVVVPPGMVGQGGTGMLIDWDWDRIDLAVSNLRALKQQSLYGVTLTYDQRQTVKRLIRELNTLLSLD